jgi:thioredoxin 2
MANIVHITCPHCLAKNRIPEYRLQDHPVCGKCKQKLFQGKPVELTGPSFNAHILKNDIPVVVDFWASWCGPCKMMAPAFTQAASELEPYARLTKLNTEQEQYLASQYNIRSIPTMIMFKNGKEVVRQSGAMDAASIVQWVKSQMY